MHIQHPRLESSENLSESFDIAHARNKDVLVKGPGDTPTHDRLNYVMSYKKLWEIKTLE